MSDLVVRIVTGRL